MKTKNFSNHLQSSTMICFIHPHPTPFFPTSSCQFCMCCLVWSPSLLFVPHEGCNFHAALACEFAADLPLDQRLLWSEGSVPSACIINFRNNASLFFQGKKLFLNHLQWGFESIESICARCDYFFHFVILINSAVCPHVVYSNLAYGILHIP